MKKRFILLVLLSFLLVSCNSNDKEILVNDEIQNKVNNAIDDVFTKVTQTIQKEDLSGFLDLCVPGTEELNTLYFTEFMNNGMLYIDFFLEKNYQNLSKYYVADIGKTIQSIDYVTEGYEFRIPESVDQGERYIHLAEGEYGEFDIVLTTVFKKVDNEWKVEKFLLGDIRPYGESLVSLIEKADRLEAEGSLISSYMFNDLAGSFVSPSPYIHYTNYKVISESIVRVADQIRKDVQFPLDLTIDGQVIKLYSVVSKKYKEGFHCEILYVTNLSEEEATEALIKEEIQLVHEKAKQVLVGLGEGFDERILYTAYFEEPITQGKDYKTLTVPLN